MTNNVPKPIINALRREIDRRGLSLAEVSRLSGWKSIQQAHKYFRKEEPYPMDLATARRIAKALEMKIEIKIKK